jgi:CDP-6-deoxy-D-xylo-4-hexulose-3-dehydrase
MLAHTLGNPFDVSAVYEIADRFGLRVIEDCCDALGAGLRLQARRGARGRRYVLVLPGAPHHDRRRRRRVLAPRRRYPRRRVDRILGARLLVPSWRERYLRAALHAAIRRFAVWLRPQEHDNAPRIQSQTYRRGSSLRPGSDHKAAEYVSARNRNFGFLRERLERLSGMLELPEATPYSQPSWFGFPITLKESGLRNQLQRYLAQRGVDSRLLFAGNITKQPYMKGRKFLVASTLEVTDRVMNDCLWIGLHPALDDEQLSYSANCIADFFGEFA